MTDYFELDFLKVDSTRSGDAITIRYSLEGEVTIHIVDAGFQDTGLDILQHVREWYNVSTAVSRVIVTHPDGDHAGGVKAVLEELDVGELWMLRPWNYVDELLHRFAKYSSADDLRARLREDYPTIRQLELIAENKGVPILEPFQGAQIGAFTSLAPSKRRYLDAVVQSERTPEPASLDEVSLSRRFAQTIRGLAQPVVSIIQSAWGEEIFSNESVSAENEMSVVQFASLCDQRILLTGDAGREALSEAADYAESAGLSLPGVDRFQVPHHGSRRNVSTDLLDRWLGERLARSDADDSRRFTAIVSAAKADELHPRKAVIRAMIHRGGRVYTTEDANLRSSFNAPQRHGWTSAQLVKYPHDQEE